MGQGDPTGNVWAGILFYGANNFKALHCFVEDMVQYGIMAYADSLTYKGEIAGNTVEYVAWNPIMAGSPSVTNDVRDIIIHDNMVEYFGDVGIAVCASDIVASNNTVRNGNIAGGSGPNTNCYMFEVTGSGETENSVFENNIAEGESDFGFTFGALVTNCSVIDPHVRDMSIDGIFFEVTATKCKVQGGSVLECKNPILDKGDDNEIIDVDVGNETTAVTAGYGYIELQGLRSAVRACRVWSGTSTANISGIRINGVTENPATGHIVDGNEIWGFDGAPGYGIRLMNNVDSCKINNNYIHDGFRAIQIEAATEAGNEVLGNRFLNITSATVVSDGGTGTILPTVRACFIKELGTAVWVTTAANPMGIDVDAADEGAMAKIKLPPDLQKVIRIVVWGTAQVDEADGMQLQVAAGAGGDNEAWNAEPIAVASKTSTSLNFSNLDNIYWVFTSADDSDIGDLVAGDFLQWCCYYAAASGADCATDLLLAGESVEIQYV